MDKQKLNDLIDRVIGKTGPLRTPAYWMRRVLNGVVGHVDDTKTELTKYVDAGLAEKLNKSISLTYQEFYEMHMSGKGLIGQWYHIKDYVPTISVGSTGASLTSDAKREKLYVEYKGSVISQGYDSEEGHYCYDYTDFEGVLITPRNSILSHLSVIYRCHNNGHGNNGLKGSEVFDTFTVTVASRTTGATIGVRKFKFISAFETSSDVYSKIKDVDTGEEWQLEGVTGRGISSGGRYKVYLRDPDNNSYVGFISPNNYTLRTYGDILWAKDEVRNIQVCYDIVGITTGPTGYYWRGYNIFIGYKDDSKGIPVVTWSAPPNDIYIDRSDNVVLGLAQHVMVKGCNNIRLSTSTSIRDVNLIGCSDITLQAFANKAYFYNCTNISVTGTCKYSTFIACNTLNISAAVNSYFGASFATFTKTVTSSTVTVAGSSASPVTISEEVNGMFQAAPSLRLQHLYLNNSGNPVQGGTYSEVKLKTTSVTDESSGKTLDVILSELGAPFIIPEDGTLPETGTAGKVYLIPSTDTEENNTLTEYLWINEAWEKVGEFKADVDLTAYAKTADIPTKVSVLDNDSDYISTQNAKDLIAEEAPNYAVLDISEGMFAENLSDAEIFDFSFQGFDSDGNDLTEMANSWRFYRFASLQSTGTAPAMLKASTYKVASLNLDTDLNGGQTFIYTLAGVNANAWGMLYGGDSTLIDAVYLYINNKEAFSTRDKGEFNQLVRFYVNIRNEVVGLWYDENLYIASYASKDNSIRPFVRTPLALGEVNLLNWDLTDFDLTYNLDGTVKATPKYTLAKLHNAIPTKVSKLTNDSGYITADDVPEEVYVVDMGNWNGEEDYNKLFAAFNAGTPVFLKQAEFLLPAGLQEIDAGLLMYYKVHQATGEPTFISGVFNKESNYQYNVYFAGGIPTKTSQLTNDSKFITADEVPSGLPEGGTAGQVLTKTEEGAEWTDPSAEITVDAELSEESTNPVQNKVLFAKIAELEAQITTLTEAVNNKLVETQRVTQEEYDAMVADGTISETTTYIIVASTDEQSDD